MFTPTLQLICIYIYKQENALFFMAKQYHVLSVLGLFERIMMGMDTVDLMSWAIPETVSWLIHLEKPLLRV